MTCKGASRAAAWQALSRAEAVFCECTLSTTAKFFTAATSPLALLLCSLPLSGPRMSPVTLHCIKKRGDEGKDGEKFRHAHANKVPLNVVGQLRGF